MDLDAIDWSMNSRKSITWSLVSGSLCLTIFIIVLKWLGSGPIGYDDRYEGERKGFRASWELPGMGSKPAGRGLELAVRASELDKMASEPAWRASERAEKASEPSERVSEPAKRV